MSMSSFFGGAFPGQDIWRFLFVLVVLVVLVFLAFKYFGSKSIAPYGFLILIVVAISMWFYIGGYSCVVSVGDMNEARAGSVFMSITNWIKINIYGCGQDLNFFGRFANKTKEILGLNQDMGDFFFNLILGLVAGLILYLLYRLIMISYGFMSTRKGTIGTILGSDSSKKDMLVARNGWLGMIAGAPWKIVVVGMFWAVLMQIPFLKTFLDIITFGSFFGLSLGVGFFVRAIVIAFYLGILPTFVESYSRYKTRMRYYERLQEIKYGIKTIKTAGGV